MSVALQVPQPPTRFILGNLPDIGMVTPVQNMLKLSRQYGPMFRLKFPAKTIMVVGGYDLVNELCDETRFEKLVHGPLERIRDLAGDGLFTADTSMPNWGRAHRILVPAFGPQAMRNYFDAMYDVAEQLVSKWARQGSRVDLDVADNMTRLTLDTIALCGFGYRFNSFYQNEMHPFVDSMVRALSEAGARSRRIPLQTKLNVIGQRQFRGDIDFMNHVVDEVIRERKAGATHGPKDLLSLMLSGKDPETGEGLDDLNIRYQMVTFLIAGHETTSGLLSFALYAMMRDPAVMKRAREEVDRVLGGATPRFEHLSQLTYLDQILRETLRLWPTAPAFGLTPKAPTRLGQYDVSPGDTLLVLIPALHRDASVWSGDVEAFDPERFSAENRAKMPENSWKPFGHGQRACIGRAFAMQEALLVLAMLLQRFELTGDAKYELKIKETLTLKPDGLTMRLKERPRLAAEPVALAPAVVHSVAAANSHGTPMRVVFGSNSGSSEAFARRFADDALLRGYNVNVTSMDALVDSMPTSGSLVVVTASYNGHPPDNAKKFCAWLDAVKPDSLRGLQFAVFGCGNRDWASTYQAVPERVEAGLLRAGASPVVSRGEADARADFFGDFERWYAPATVAFDSTFKVTKTETATATALYAVKTLEHAVDVARGQGFSTATVLENRELAPTGRSKRHVVLKMPEGVTFAVGDSLAVLAENSPEVVARAAARFGLSLDAVIQLDTQRPTAAGLPVGKPMTVRAVLSSFVELSQPATLRQVVQLLAVTRCPPEKKRLEPLADEATYRREVLEKRVSVLDLLEANPASELTFAAFLEMLPLNRARLYSVASSPTRDSTTCALTVSVIDAKAWSGKGQFRGVGSSYLATRAVGDSVLISVRPPNTAFRLPADSSTPIIMIAAGSGLAPFRGFVEERVAQGATGESVVFFGCDHPEVDFLYRDDFAGWKTAVYPAFSEAPVNDVRFVQHRLWQERELVAGLIARGAKVFICGDGARMAPAVREVLARIVGGPDQFAAFVAEGRLVADVFS